MNIKDATRFFREVKTELSKVVWPKFNEWIGSTIVVLFLTCIFAIYLGVVDLGFFKLIKYVFKQYGGY